MNDAPLDLQAIEARYPLRDPQPFSGEEDIRALLAALRAHREALAPLAKARYADPVSVEFGLVKGADMLRAQAVLVSVADDPAVRVGDRETPP